MTQLPYVSIFDHKRGQILPEGTYAIFPRHPVPTSFMLITKHGWKERYFGEGRFSLSLYDPAEYEPRREGAIIWYDKKGTV